MHAIRACTGKYTRAIRLLTDVKRSTATAASTTAAAASAAASKQVSDEAGVAKIVAGAVGDPQAVEEAVAELGDKVDAESVNKAVAKSVCWMQIR